MKRVLKYELIVDDEAILEMPSSADVLHIGVQDPNTPSVLQVWALVDDASPAIRHRFRVAGTGHPIPDADELEYVQSVQAPPFVWHVFRDAPADLHLDITSDEAKSRRDLEGIGLHSAQSQILTERIREGLPRIRRTGSRRLIASAIFALLHLHERDR